MPIRINLKEIFPSDPQEINVEKVNFNFNKLLELGIGTPGPIGLTGPQGPAGPIGLTGPQGIRGATWWVDSGIPSTHTFAGLLDGDLYLDNTSFDVWLWDSTTSTWTLEVGISSIINTYLAANGSPFVKTIKSLPSGNIDGRFITFSERADTNDLTRGAGSTSKNYSLFLTNFDEEKVNLAPMPPIDWPPNVNTLYNSIVSIFVNHADGQLSSAAELGRYHLELGSLYNDTIDTRISEVQHNLKIRYIKQYITTPNLLLTNEWINTAQFSLSVDEGRGISSIDQNGVFNFITPKLNIENPLNTVQDELNTRVGPWESHVEIPSLDYVRADGISFELLSSFLGANIGIALNYVSAYPRLNGKELFMLDSNINVVGTLINDKTYIIGDTNVIGKISIGDIDPVSDLTVSGGVSIGSSYNTILAPTNGAIIEGKVGINISSPISELDIFGSINIDSGITNTSPRPALTAGSLLHGEIRGYTNANPNSDTGFLRLSAGAGTDINTKSFIDLSGYSTDLTVDKNIIIGTSGLERMQVDKNGTVAIGTSIPDNAVNLHVSGGVKFEGSGESPGVPATLTTNGDAVGAWTPLSEVGVPVGAIMMWYTSAIPTGWVICNGGSTAPYPKLAAVIGGALPDLRGAFIVGAGQGVNSNGGNYGLQTNGGELNVTLSTAQVPLIAHTHPVAVSGSTATDGTHVHSLKTGNGTGGGAFDIGEDKGDGWYHDADDGAHAHAISITGTAGANIATSATSHNNLPPYFAVHYIIKY